MPFFTVQNSGEPSLLQSPNINMRAHRVDPGGVADDAKASATLRVSLRQAVVLTAAQNFAREVRLVPRPPGDGRRLGAVGVSAAGFRR